MAYKVEGLSNKGGRFEHKNDDLSIFTDSGVRILFIEVDHRLELTIRIDSDTTLEQVREAWPLITEWRSRLLEYQGPWLHGGRLHFLNMLHLQHKSGESYSKIAERLNKTISEDLIKYWRVVVDYEEVKDTFMIGSDYDQWLFAQVGLEDRDPYGLNHAQTLLEYCRIKDAETWLKEALERISEGKEPFLFGYEPVTRDKVIGLIAWWRESKEFKLANEQGWQL